MKTILVVEDDPAIAELLLGILADAGYETAWAPDGREGMTILATSRPDLVITDLMMPYVDGWEVCRAIQTHPIYRKIPILVLSTVPPRTLPQLRPQDAYLPKPFEIDDLLNTIARLLAQRIARSSPSRPAQDELG